VFSPRSADILVCCTADILVGRARPRPTTPNSRTRGQSGRMPLPLRRHLGRARLIDRPQDPAVEVRTTPIPFRGPKARIHPSLGQRPRNVGWWILGLKARSNWSRHTPPARCPPKTDIPQAGFTSQQTNLGRFGINPREPGVRKARPPTDQPSTGPKRADRQTFPLPRAVRSPKIEASRT